VSGDLRVGLLTREYPPEVYGGAGVHVEYLARQLGRIPGIHVEVRCFGAPRHRPEVAAAYEPWDELPPSREGAALGALSVDLRMAADLGGVDLAHSHTWYANLGGHLAHLAWGIPHVATCHSLEPLRPWKAEQLGGGYAISSWAERTALESADAVIAVSGGMRDDVLSAFPAVDPGRVRVIHNGIDAAEYCPDPGTDVLRRLGVDPDRPYVMFVGRVTRQKGIEHLLDAAVAIDPDAALVLCAGAPDTPELGAAMRDRARQLAASRGRVHWIEDMLPRPDIVQLLGHAAVFVCPSVYEPFGLINVEAMACATPVVASAVGGIPEIVVDGETGILVPFEAGADPYGSPADPVRFAADLASAVNTLLADPARAAAMGRAGRQRVLERFTWEEIAAQTAALYREVLAG
jgi:alpha-maltose-1-phosphate synthase